MTRKTLCFLCTLTLFCNMTSVAQHSEGNPTPEASKAKPAPAPVPAQITNARKVFVANGGGENLYKGGPNHAYDEFYGAMKDSGQFELTGSPAEADLVLEISQ